MPINATLVSYNTLFTPGTASTIESDTTKYQEFITKYCYECVARVAIPEALNK